MLEPTEYDYKLVILGKPEPQGRPRTRIVTPTDRKPFVAIYTDSRSRKAKENIAALGKLHRPDERPDGALRVDVFFYMPRPLGHYGTGRNAGKLKDRFASIPHTSKPDGDNLYKLVTDALNEIFWKDDSQIVEHHVSKRYSERPRTEIFVTILKTEGKELW